MMMLSDMQRKKKKVMFLISTWSNARHSSTPGLKTDQILYTSGLTCEALIEVSMRMTSEPYTLTEVKCGIGLF